MMPPGQIAVSERYGAAVWDWLAAEPDREADEVRLYTRESHYSEEMAQNRFNEVRRRVARAERDKDFALAWAKRILASGDMHDAFKRLPFGAKVAQAQQQDYDDARVRFRRAVEEGRFEQMRVPSERLRPDEHRAFLQVQKEWLESLEGVEA